MRVRVLVLRASCFVLVFVLMAYVTCAYMLMLMAGAIVNMGMAMASRTLYTYCIRAVSTTHTGWFSMSLFAFCILEDNIRIS